MTITLEDLRPAEGSTHKSKRVGRGRSSGHGKTSCRGHNGEGQRSGNSSKRGFEGGQMPAYRRLPKLKGFQVYKKPVSAEINVGRLAQLCFFHYIPSFFLILLSKIEKVNIKRKKKGNCNQITALNVIRSFCNFSVNGDPRRIARIVCNRSTLY